MNMTNNTWSVNFVLGDDEAVITHVQGETQPFVLEVFGIHVADFDNIDDAFAEADARVAFENAKDLVADELFDEETNLLKLIDATETLELILPLEVYLGLINVLSSDLDEVRDFMDELAAYSFDEFQEDHEAYLAELEEELDEVNEDIDGLNEMIEEVQDDTDQFIFYMGPISVI